MCSFSDLLTGIGTLLAGMAASYGALQGLKAYRESIMQKTIDTLLQMEKQFNRLLPTFSLIEDSYDDKIRPVLNDPNQDPSLATDIDRCFALLLLVLCEIATELWDRRLVPRLCVLLRCAHGSEGTAGTLPVYTGLFPYLKFDQCTNSILKTHSHPNRHPSGLFFYFINLVIH
jgi:hypothetical protein